MEQTHIVSSLFKKGHIPWNKNKKYNVLKFHKLNCQCYFCKARRKETKGKDNSFYNKKHSKDTKRKMSENHANFFGENNPAWNGGSSFEPYTPEFNGKLKQFIRERDNNICQFCGKTRKENNQELSINHINYIKEDCKPRNLIALCRGCNSKINYDREKWQFLFEILQEIRVI